MDGWLADWLKESMDLLITQFINCFELKNCEHSSN